MSYDFDKIICRLGTYSTQWDYIEDRFHEKDLLPFSISDTDFETPNIVVDDLKKRLEHKIYGYTRWNHKEFKEAIQYHYKTRMHTSIDSDWIAYSPSVMYSVSVLIQLLSKPQDGVVVFDPMYDAFINVIEKNDREMLCSALDKDHNFSIDFEDVEQKLKNARIFLLCSPHNPTGRVFQKDELMKLCMLCKKYNVYIISDEIHSDMILFNNTHMPILSFYETYQHMILVSSASKTFNTPGLGGSYVIIPEQHVYDSFMVQTRQKDFVNSANIMGMYALISAYTKAQDYIDELIIYIEDNMRYVEQFLQRELPDFKFIVPQATYLAWIDIRNVPYTSQEVQKALVEVGKVGIMDGGVYGRNGEHYLRMNLGCPRAKIEKGLTCIKIAMKHLYESEQC